MNQNWFNELRDRQDLKRAQQEGRIRGVERACLLELIGHLDAQLDAAQQIGDGDLIVTVSIQRLEAQVNLFEMELEDAKRMLAVAREVRQMQVAHDDSEKPTKEGN
jgi:hypothetical protein